MKSWESLKATLFGNSLCDFFSVAHKHKNLYFDMQKFMIIGNTYLYKTE